MTSLLLRNKNIHTHWTIRMDICTLKSETGYRSYLHYFPFALMKSYMLIKLSFLYFQNIPTPFTLLLIPLEIRFHEFSRWFPAGIYLFRVKNRNSRTICEICSKLTIKTPERRQWRYSGVFIVNFEHILHLVLLFVLLTLNR